MAKKITELTALATPVGTDILPIVDDPGGTPVTKKVTVDNLLALAKPTIGNEVSGATAGRVLFVEDDAGTPVLADSAGLTFDGSQLGLGVTPSVKFQMVEHLRIDRASASASVPPVFDTRRARGTLASPSIVQSGDHVLRLRAHGYDGSSFAGAAEIVMEVDGTPGAGDMPGRIVFNTTPDGSTAPTEAMRITQDGRVAIGGFSDPSDALEVRGTGAGSNIRINETSTGNPTFIFQKSGANNWELGIRGTEGDDLVVRDGTAGTVMQRWGSDVYMRFPSTDTGTGLIVSTNDGSLQIVKRDSSTGRIKKNIRPITFEDARPLLDIGPVTYAMKDSGMTDSGFLAEDFHAAGLTAMLTYDGDGLVNGFKNFGRGITAYLHAIVREQQRRIEALEAAA